MHKISKYREIAPNTSKQKITADYLSPFAFLGYSIIMIKRFFCSHIEFLQKDDIFLWI